MAGKCFIQHCITRWYWIYECACYKFRGPCIILVTIQRKGQGSCDVWSLAVINQVTGLCTDPTE